MKLLETVGNSPLVFLESFSRECGANIYVKLESRNPGGSVKDRVALAMLQGATSRAELAPGGRVIEATSGNLGIGLALVCRQLGFDLTLAMPASVSEERKALLNGMGVELVLTPAPEGMNGAVKKARELQAAHPGSLLVDQFSNPDGPKAHYQGTGEEIIQAMNAKGQEVHAFVAGVGSGGTITGAGKRLREKWASIWLAALEPADSPVLSGGKPAPHPIQGIGAGFVPTVLDKSLLSEVLTIASPDAFENARKALLLEGLSCGISSGANLFGAITLGRRPEFQGKNIVTIICDGGERYMSTALFKKSDGAGK